MAAASLLLALQAVTPDLAAIGAGIVQARARLEIVERVVAAAKSGSGSLEASETDLATLRSFKTCEPSQAEATGVDWYGVVWDCAADTRIRSAETFFKFAENKIVAVQVGPTPPIIKTVH